MLSSRKCSVLRCSHLPAGRPGEAPSLAVSLRLSGSIISASAGVVSGTAGRGRQHGGDSSAGTETRIQESGTYTHLCVHSAGQSAQLTGWHRQHTGLPHRNS